jgi:hypothetical protein
MKSEREPDSATLNRASPANRERAVTACSTALTQAVRHIALDKSVPVFEKRRKISDLVERELKARGQFFRTRDGMHCYLLNSERRVLDLNHRPFHHLLKSLSGLAATEGFFRFLLDRLQTTAEQTQPIEVRTLSHYDARTGLLVVSDGGSGVWRRELGGPWTQGVNGQDGLMFLTDVDAETWTPEFSSGNHFSWFLQQFRFTDYISRLDREDQTSLYLMNLLHCFFPVLRKTRMIPAFLGTQGSGKSTALRLTGRLLVGPCFEVSDVRRDGQVAFVFAAANRIVCALDNVDSKIPWLQDALSRYATGVRYNIRLRYSRNEVISYEPRALIMISSREPHFTRGDVSERLLPFYCGRPEQFVPELVIFDELARRRGAIMGDLLQRLGNIADRLAESEASAVPYRMADFASFFLRLSEASGSKEVGSRLLKRLQLAQADFTSESDDVIAVLRVLLLNGGQIGPIAVRELFKQCTKIAGEQTLSLPTTVQGFGQRLTAMKSVIELELNARFTDIRSHANMRIIEITRVDPRSKQMRSLHRTNQLGG